MKVYLHVFSGFSSLKGNKSVQTGNMKVHHNIITQDSTCTHLNWTIGLQSGLSTKMFQDTIYLIS